MEKKRFYIRHISQGILVKTKNGMPVYTPKWNPSVVWLGTFAQAQRKLSELGRQLHDIGEWIC